MKLKKNMNKFTLIWNNNNKSNKNLQEQAWKLKVNLII